MLVLAVDLDEVVAEPLEQRHRDRRVVDEGAVAAGARELAADEELAVAGGSPASSRTPPPASRAPTSKRASTVAVSASAADHVGLRARAAHEEDGVDQDRLAGARLAGEDVEPARELDGGALDHGEVPDAQLAQHRAEG